MTCAGCERAIKKVVSGLPGVLHAEADLASATVSMEYNPEKVNVEEIKSAIARIGYKVTGERPPLGQKEGRDDAVS